MLADKPNAQQENLSVSVQALPSLSTGWGDAESAGRRRGGTVQVAKLRMGFVVPQVMRHENSSVLELDGKEVSVFTPSKPREKWLRKRTHVKLRVRGSGGCLCCSRESCHLRGLQFGLQERC